MDLKDLLTTVRGCSDKDVAFFSNADLVADAEDGVATTVGVKGEVVETAISQAVSIIFKLSAKCPPTQHVLVRLILHFVFLTFAINSTLARFDMHLCTALPPRRPARCWMRGVGTTSWFLLPCSTCASLSTCQREEN